jgi:cell division septum initiation protein DivIVA
VKESLRNDASDSEAGLTSSFLRNPSLRRQLFGGYATEDTDALLQHAATTIDSLRKSVTELKQGQTAPKQSQAAPAAPPAERPPLRLAEGIQQPRLGITEADQVSTATAVAVGEVMISAHQAIELLKEKAQQEAHKIIEDAQGHAATILAEAAKERARSEEARTTADKIQEDAHAEATSIVERATRERDQIIAESERFKTIAEDMRRQWLGQMNKMIE